MRLLGAPQIGIRKVNGYSAQYFEKGRLEDHQIDTKDPAWRMMDGRLTAELMERTPDTFANSTNLTYADLRRASTARQPVPAGFTSGTVAVEGGVFVPSDAHLRAAPGYVVPERLLELHQSAGAVSRSLAAERWLTVEQRGQSPNGQAWPAPYHHNAGL